MILAALFFAAMTLLNILGMTRFIQMGPLALAVGVLPYPLTFLITDLISELYGKERANFVVWVGLGLNLFVLFFLYVGQLAAAVPAAAQPPWQVLNLQDPIQLSNGVVVQGPTDLFYIVYSCATGSVFASMLAYVTAQFFDVQIFHYLKHKTRGKALWLRNNMSTLCSQWIDTVVVISVTFYGSVMSGAMTWKTFFMIMGSNYLFKMVAALLDTFPFYFFVYRLRAYLQIPE